MGIKNIINKAGQKAGDAIAKVSSLSPEQLEKVQEEREKYLVEKPDPSDVTAEETTGRLIAAGAVEIYNAYLKQIKELYVPVETKYEYGERFDLHHNIRFINITKWVIDKEEDSLDKLINVYDVLSNENCNIALVFNRTKDNTDVYLAVVNTENADNNVNADAYMHRIKDAINGNFPGSEWSDVEGVGILPCLNNKKDYSVACASNIPAEKTEKFLNQTMEKLIDGVIPKNDEQEYVVILMATPMKDIEDRKLHLAELYGALSPFASWQTSFQMNEMTAIGSSATAGVNLGVSAGVQSGQNQAVSQNESVTDTETASGTKSESESQSHSDSENTANTVGGSVGGHIGTTFYGGNANVFGSHTKGKGITDTVGKSVTDSVTKGLSKAIGQTVGKTAGTFASHNLGGNFGVNFSRASNVTATVGKNESINQNFTNYTIKHTLELLEQQMKRYDQCSAMGMWDFAAYVLSEDSNIVNNVAHTYIALTQGKESYMSETAVNVWRGDLGENSKSAKEICDYLRELRHPIFGINPGIVEMDSTYLVYPPVVTATTGLSGKELSYSLNFPKKSIPGLPVIECAEFGRNVTTYNDNKNEKWKIDLGNIFHMNHEEQEPVWLATNSLASHTFVTGSTGSGKSNTVYQIVNEAAKQSIKFMVIEPAKGEYKHAFSNRDDVNVYGTNPKLTPLLRINPFSFPKGIHVLEHIDRLVEIFNVCWPMYAAMPAVLKNAVEKSYVDCGWDLVKSENTYGDNFYPSFNDVCKNVKVIIDSSEYDAENKGAYKGSLLTRLQSLTNGIYGMIFTDDEVSDKEFFEENVIVDLSRVGSAETKSLLMGLMVLKLQEYRTSNFSGMNEELKHITILEEAHNLLKRTSVEQGSESANLTGKSVEMIANAIAEMRTYGEGFIIADQSPGLLDMAAIRNTNTKIIMRLPDLMDRELVGKAANLNDEQIEELAKLPLGVAAVYQNEWIQPILCKVKRAKVSTKLYSFENAVTLATDVSIEDRKEIATLLSKCTNIDNINLVREKVDALNIDTSLKVAIIRWISNPPKEPKMTKLAPLMSALFPEIKQVVVDAYNDINDPKEWTALVQNTINEMNMENLENQVRRDIIQAIITDHIYLEKNNLNDLKKWAEIGGF